MASAAKNTTAVVLKERKKLQKLEKELEIEQNKMKQEKDRMRAERKKLEKMSKEISEQQSKLRKQNSSSIKSMNKEITELRNQNKLLKKSVRQSNLGTSDNIGDKRSKQFKKESLLLKKKLKQTLKELEKKKLYYKTQIRKFQNQQER